MGFMEILARCARGLILFTTKSVIDAKLVALALLTLINIRNKRTVFREFRLLCKVTIELSTTMTAQEDIKRPTKEEQEVAKASYLALATALTQLQTENPEIEIEETQERIKLPLKALELLTAVLKAMGEGKPISIVPIATEMTTQKAAEVLGCSRPHLVKLLEEGQIPYTLIGKHRRVKFEDVMGYRKQLKDKQRQLLIEIMKTDEESGLYDT